MKVFVNEDFIQKRAKITRWVSIAGLGVLLLGLIVSFNKEYYFWSLPALVIGIFLASISGFNANRYVKEPRPDQSLAKALRGFDNNYHLFNYTARISHVFLTPSRVYAVLVKPQEGVVRQQGNRWRRDFSLKRLFLFFGDEGLGNLSRDARAEAERLQDGLEDAFGEEAPAVEALVVFTNPKTELEMREPETEDAVVLTGKNLKKYIRAQRKGQPFSSDLRRRLVAFLKGEEIEQDEDAG
jgi:hypothetical protein